MKPLNPTDRNYTLIICTENNSPNGGAVHAGKRASNDALASLVSKSNTRHSAAIQASCGVAHNEAPVAISLVF